MPMAGFVREPGHYVLLYVVGYDAGCCKEFAWAIHCEAEQVNRYVTESDGFVAVTQWLDGGQEEDCRHVWQVCRDCGSVLMKIARNSS